MDYEKIFKILINIYAEQEEIKVEKIILERRPQKCKTTKHKKNDLAECETKM